jgi:hypothetical protein
MNILKRDHTWDLPPSVGEPSSIIGISAVVYRRHPDKAQLKETILALRAARWSYREIGREVGVHFTRIGQILKNLTTE